MRTHLGDVGGGDDSFFHSLFGDAVDVEAFAVVGDLHDNAVASLESRE